MKYLEVDTSIVIVLGAITFLLGWMLGRFFLEEKGKSREDQVKKEMEEIKKQLKGYR